MWGLAVIALRQYIGQNMIISSVGRYSWASSEIQIWGGEEELCDLQVGSSSGWRWQRDPQLHSGEERQLKAGDWLELCHLHTERMSIPGAQTHREEGVHLQGQGREQVWPWSILHLQTPHRQESFRYVIIYYDLFWISYMRNFLLLAVFLMILSAQKKDRMIQFYLVFNMQKVLIRWGFFNVTQIQQI